MKSCTYQEIVERFGEEIADKAISTGAEPTSRYIYPAFEPQHVGLKEWAEAPIEIDGVQDTRILLLDRRG